MALTKRELHRRIANARNELSASLFFMVPPKGGKRSSVRQLRYQLDQNMKTALHLIDALKTGDFQDEQCEGCGNPIRPGEHFVHYDDGPNVHTRCCGKKVPKRYVQRRETQREEDRYNAKHFKAAREYLKKRGLIA